MSKERMDPWKNPTYADLCAMSDEASPRPWYPTTTAGQSGALTCHASGPEHGRPNGVDWHPQAVADSYLVAAMRNALPVLLDLVRAAQALDGTFDDDGLVTCKAAHLRLAVRAALAKLATP